LKAQGNGASLDSSKIEAEIERLTALGDDEGINKLLMQSY
jgi:hypothetical protein